jgi:DNA (cytosine-5)-methyltransferase 1
MSDVLTPAQRSYNMSRIRSVDTGPEVYLRNLLSSAGFHGFDMHPKSIPGRPDFYFRFHRLALFVDGCFWHGCKACFQMPATNTSFWTKKINTNILRDRKVNRMLEAQGITPLRIREHELKGDASKILERIRVKLRENYRPRVLDLFAGAGGFSEGFIEAGCEIIGHIEMDKNACDTLITRMVYHALLKKGGLNDYRKYVLGEITRDSLIEKHGLQKERDSVICAEIEKENHRKLIRHVKDRLAGQPLDIIIGGPPCQAYSHIGRARDDRNMRGDRRNFLYRYYVEFLKALKPKLFVFENVPGLETAGKGRYLGDMRNLMKRAGYETDYRVLDAEDYGVPQSRKRIILVGWNKESAMTGYPEFPQVERGYRVGDFLADLPKLRAGRGERIKIFSERNELLEQLGIVDPRFGVLMDHMARPNNSRDREIYRRAVLCKEGGENIKYNSLPEKLKTHRNKDGFLDRFKVVDRSARGSQTVVAHIAKDGHYYIHPDLQQNRSLTVREAARLQTFPDDYKFEGGRGPQFRQIGNAVPPMLSSVIARELIKYL